MRPETIQHELAGLRALARSLVHGDADAEDLLQDAALAALVHRPAVDDDRPVAGWFATVLRNRRRMIARGAARRQARERATAADEVAVESPPDALDRVRSLEQLAAALAALDEPFRTTVIRRYLDGQTAADIAREMDVPAGTVRWRLKTGLERLRAALDARERSWRRALVPLVGVSVKAKSSSAFVIGILIALLLGIAALVIAWPRGNDTDSSAVVGSGSPSARSAAIADGNASPRSPDDAAIVEPLPGQGLAIVEQRPGEPGSVTGRVINWSTGEGVADAELTFTGASGAVTVASTAGGAFSLAPTAPGRFALTAITAAGFLPYAPELLHSNVHLEVTRERAVRGITVFLFPAIDYRGRVVDKQGQPVAGAKVRLLGTPSGEQVLEKLATEWTTSKDGTFAFHAADDAVLEATHRAARGWGVVNGDVQVTRELAITLGDAPARDATISGRVVDATGQPLADVLVRAEPDAPPGKDDPLRSTAFATSGPDGAFVLEHLDRALYELAATDDDFAPLVKRGIAGGARDVRLTMDRGKSIAGTVTSAGQPVPAYTLLVLGKRGTTRELVTARSIVAATGRFEIRVADGDYEVIASASGLAPSEPIAAKAGQTDIAISLSAGAILRGRVVSSAGGAPVGYARVMREARGGGASAQPANAGTVTRADGTFELAGIPPGPLSITIGAGGFHPKIEAGLVASEGATLGPITVSLAPLAPGEKPTLELVGIGVKLVGDGDALRVDMVVPNGGAAEAGIVVGDRLVAVDGLSVVDLGIDGAVGKIRGVEGTTVSVTLKRGESTVTLVVTRKKLRA